MRIPLYQIDAFADGPFTGNPAAVCPLDAWLPAETMQAIAAENNLSETAFFVPEGDGYRLRWFTPSVEVDLCGHATLASAFVVFRYLAPGRDSVTFQTEKAGRLTVGRDGDDLVLDFPARPPLPCPMSEAVAAALGRPPAALLASRDYLAVYDEADEIAVAQPRFRRTGDARPVRRDRDGAGRPTGVDFVSRFFAPARGVPEDPVTGSAHCTLIPYWAERLGKPGWKRVSCRGAAAACPAAITVTG